MHISPKVKIANMEIFLYITVVLSVINYGQTSSDDTHMWTISPIYVEVTPGMTENLQLRCERKNIFSQDNITPYSVRVEKKESNQWKMVAEVINGAAVNINDPYVTATSDFSSNSPVNFVELVWSEVTESALGIYRCEDMASAPSGFIVETSPEMEIAEVSTTTLKILNFWNWIYPDLSQILQPGNNTNNTVDVDDLKTKVALLGQDVEQLAFETTWFDGDYALLMADTGCPLAFSHLPSYMQVHEDSSRRDCFVSDQTNHLLQPLHYEERNDCFLRLQFCESGAEVTGMAWPSGRYCINKKQNYDCPTGLTSSVLDLDFEDSKTIYEYRGGVVTDENKNKLPFCCASTGNATKAISIPTGTPFYLYRQGGECQQVRGMNVTPEVLDIDTEHGINRDKMIGEITPDIVSNGGDKESLRVHLCYYVPSS